MSDEGYPYSCDAKITFPTEKQADIALKVMQVDEEIGNRGRKSLRINDNDPKSLKM